MAPEIADHYLLDSPDAAVGIATGIACATAGLRRRFAARVWRDYYKHVDARRRYANPTDEGLAAQQRDRQIEEESRRRENEERVAQYNYFAARASNRSAWARAGMG